MDVYSAFLEVAKKDPYKPALYFLGEKMTFLFIRQAVEHFSSGLTSIGVKEGDRVMIYLPNTPQWIISWLSIQKIGAIAVPITPIYTSRDVRYIGSDSESRTIICADTNFGYVKELKEEGLFEHVIVSNLADLLPNYKKFIGRMFDRIPTGKSGKGRGIHTF